MDDETHRQLMSLAEEDPTTEVSINLEDQQLILPDGRKVEFPIDGFSKYCLLNGVDQLGYLMGLEDEIVEYEGSHDKRVVTTA